MTYNDNGTEIIAGTVPAKITFDATEVFSDFSLPDYTILWDVNDDGEMERQNTASFTYTYTGAKLYNVNIRFP
ncbi:hypothetical protein KKH82_03835 [Patescibacteria group bacterium]|nr:hypothetical protein [Patescibacteria group bacterium]